MGEDDRVATAIEQLLAAGREATLTIRRDPGALVLRYEDDFAGMRRSVSRMLNPEIERKAFTGADAALAFALDRMRDEVGGPREGVAGQAEP